MYLGVQEHIDVLQATISRGICEASIVQSFIDCEPQHLCSLEIGLCFHVFSIVSDLFGSFGEPIQFQ